jgi:hypothetical protein
MARVDILPALLLFVASCAGGQSGDDGDVPQQPCATIEADLRSDDATMFGASGEELVARVAPDESSPFFWVPYDAIDVGAFMPRDGQTSLTLHISARAGESVHQVLSAPLPRYASSDGCTPTTVTIPVHAELSTTDGKLAASFDAPLEFRAGAVASLYSELGAESLSAGVTFEPLGEDASNGKLLGFVVGIQLWPGGSQGRISPRFSRRGPGPLPDAAAPGSDPGAIPIPAVPAHWSSIAVWPRREACAGDDRAYAATDRIVGSSVADAVAAFNARAERTLEASDGSARVRFTLDAPSGLICASVADSRLRFRVPGQLDAAASNGSYQLSHLASRNNYYLTAGANLDGTTFDLLRWTGVGVDQARTDFIVATGLGADFPAEYERFWWTWYGSDARETATGAWSSRGELAVNGLSPEQVEQWASQVANDDPRSGALGAGDGSVTLIVGDPLLSADIVE